MAERTARSGEIRLDGRAAIVTGAGRGLGRSHAHLFAERGASVLVNDIAGAEEVAEEIRRTGGRAVACEETVATPEGGEAIVARCLDAFGSVDVLVANAGIVRFAPYDDVTADELRELLSVNLEGTFWVSQSAYRVMKARGFGRVVFTASSSGVHGQDELASYAAAKAGVVGLAFTLAHEGRPHGVLVNVVCPYADTPMTHARVAASGMGDRLAPDGVSPVVLYLGSDECTITHTVFAAGGGAVARLFVGLTPAIDGDGAPLSPERIRDHLDVLMDTTGFTMPTTTGEEMRELLAARRRP